MWEVSAKIEICTGSMTTQKGNISKNRNGVSGKIPRGGEV